MKQQYTDYKENVYGQFQSLLLFMDQLLNQGKNFESILPPTYEDAVAANTESPKEKQNSQFKQGTWWKPEQNA
ncbi:hypothetical protein [Bacillus sp. BR3(2024)]